VNETRQSLLLRAQTGEEDAWKDLTALYRPLMIGWLQHQGVPVNERDDLVQDILLEVVKSLPAFDHTGRRGAFRCWLRTIAQSRACAYWRVRSKRPKATSDTDAADIVSQLEDPHSALNQLWEEEHDQYVLDCLLDLMELEFEPITVQAFRRVVLEGATPVAAAQELGLSVGSVYAAKSRILARLREEAAGLVDEFA
jgi:RNA polymerase sigma factor (sigma-70 family)